MKRLVSLVWTLLVAGTLAAQSVSLKDPAGDDDGPGTYVYPTDAVYTRGAFDLVAFQLTPNGARTEAAVTVNSDLEDPWSTGNGFAIQMAFIFIDKDGKPGSGHTEGLPGLNITFAADSAWEKVIVLSPLAPARIKGEVEQKTGALQKDIVIPSRTRGAGRKILATLDTEALGPGDPATWSYQVILQSSESFPSGTDLLVRKVNEYEGQHRFGGGHDMDCDPHVLDLLARTASGAKEEVDLQHKMLAHECTADGTGGKLAVVSMVRPR